MEEFLGPLDVFKFTFSERPLSKVPLHQSSENAMKWFVEVREVDLGESTSDYESVAAMVDLYEITFVY